MAIPIFRASISQSQIQPSIHYFSATRSRVDETNKKRKMVLSCSPSQFRPTRSEVSFSVGTYLIPHPKKVDRGGEDAFLVSSYEGGVIAVADGVSGWAEEDVDPSLFPRELLANASSFVGDEEVNYDPQNLIRKAHAATSFIGSATVIVAMLEKNGTLKIANVGDCGLRVIRCGDVVFATSPQEHYFDCPFQLSSQKAGQTYLDAVVSKVELMERDTIIMGSDGLFDNVFDHEMVSIIASYTDVSEAAKALANLASNHAKDSNFDSPYSIEARSRAES
ncbi:probable protein phosphatase 2C 26 isoform X2 [Neltuma alba]|uniref:probable protein phosphatase 2C 26 isoform X2 n=1 Tax=Neltuma alba TaxID=207710 RepID=UPI0010A4907E|nr:probable protein phosphatase 2C 26 isoform X2 [Prosopis alba]XP_028791895.1 probable protein phosphatase 2C 26 isoform X2 [Prosopis alba]